MVAEALANAGPPSFVSVFIVLLLIGRVELGCGWLAHWTTRHRVDVPRTFGPWNDAHHDVACGLPKVGQIGHAKRSHLTGVFLRLWIKLLQDQHIADLEAPIIVANLECLLTSNDRCVKQRPRFECMNRAHPSPPSPATGGVR